MQQMGSSQMWEKKLIKYNNSYKAKYSKPPGRDILMNPFFTTTTSQCLKQMDKEIL